jgi:hypothetical protein
MQEVSLNTQTTSQPLAVLSGDEFFLCDAIPTFAGGRGKCSKAVFREQGRSLNATSTLNANGTLVQPLVDGAQRGLSPADLQCAEVSPWVFQE